MNWMLTASGTEYHMDGWYFLANEVSLQDVAHALSQINRFTGHARRPYSVAEHSLLAAQIAQEMGAPPSAQLACLLHDAHEAFIGDLGSPVKWAVGGVWKVFEAQHELRVAKALGVWPAMCAHRQLVKQIDLICLATERRDLLAWKPDTCMSWAALDAPGREVQPWHEDLNNPARIDAAWEDWRQEFLSAATTLRAQVEASIA